MFDNMQVLGCKQTRELSSRGRCLETQPGLHDNIAAKKAQTTSTLYVCVTCKCLRPVLRREGGAARKGAQVIRTRPAAAAH
jgi:hypothetical protein